MSLIRQSALRPMHKRFMLDHVFISVTHPPTGCPDLKGFGSNGLDPDGDSLEAVYKSWPHL